MAIKAQGIAIAGYAKRKENIHLLGHAWLDNSSELSTNTLSHY